MPYYLYSESKLGAVPKPHENIHLQTVTIREDTIPASSEITEHWHIQHAWSEKHGWNSDCNQIYQIPEGIKLKDTIDFGSCNVLNYVARNEVGKEEDDSSMLVPDTVGSRDEYHRQVKASVLPDDN